MKKSVIRKEMKNRRKIMDDSERRTKDKDILRNLINLNEFAKNKWFYVYVSYGTETDTIKLIEYLFELKKSREIHVAVPKVLGDEMEFFEIDSLDELEKGCMGILEPSNDNQTKPEHAVMIMPGLAFDMEHGRVGYGGGYYDKYLARYGTDRFLKIAICYDYQLYSDETIESDDNDIRVDMIVTNDRCYF